MKFTLSWLKEHLDTSANADVIAEKLTSLGLEVEDYTDLGKKYEPFIIAEIQEAEKHPNADKLRVCKVNTGKEVLQIVCGAPNARAGIKVILAPVGANIPNGNFQIKKSKIRDVESNGMLCSAEELDLGTDSDGIVELSADAKIGDKYAEFAGLNDTLFEIAVTPNRADCLGIRGIARDLAAGGLGSLKPLQNTEIKLSGKSPISVNSESYYIGCYIKGVKNIASPECAANKLKAVGQTPISALVDITNYSTIELARPLHVFDADKLSGNITVRHAKKGEKINALNNKTYELDGELVIADDKGVVALAGVIGGVESSVDENTKNVFLEVGYFNAADVAASGRKHQIDSDARHRFERFIDPDFMETGAKVAASLITQICGGEASELVIAGKKPDTAREIKFDFEKIKLFAGIEISKTDAEKILTNVGFKVSGSSVSVPSWRADVEGPADIAEEILRVYGYDKAPLQPLPFAGRQTLPQFAVNRNNARAILAARGFAETVNYSFIEPVTASIFGNTVQLVNPISVELSEMRPSILPGLLKAAGNNANRGAASLAAFEIGPIFDSASEKFAVAGIRTGSDSAKNLFGKSRSVDVFDVKADALAVLESLGVKDPQIKLEAPQYMHPGRSGVFAQGKNVLGYFGELHPAILKTLDIESAAAGFEIFLENIPEARRKYKKFEALDLQAVSRDFAFVINNDVRADDLAANIRKTDQLITNVDIFDVYTGDKVEKGQKSVALSVNIQPREKTLTDSEIEVISKKITDSVAAKFGGILRK